MRIILHDTYRQNTYISHAIIFIMNYLYYNDTKSFLEDYENLDFSELLSRNYRELYRSEPGLFIRNSWTGSIGYLYKIINELCVVIIKIIHYKDNCMAYICVLSIYIMQNNSHASCIKIYLKLYYRNCARHLEFPL